MPLTMEQSDALGQIKNWAKGDEDDFMFTLHGFAGTGKTFLMQHLINSWGDDIICCAPTGKAASVLKSKLDGHDVSTIHSLLYSPDSPAIEEYKLLKALAKENPDDQELANDLEDMRRRLTDVKLTFSYSGGTDIAPGQLVVVDEASMVTKGMLDDFRETQAKVLFVGDGGQLPPVGDGGWFINNKPDAILQEVQRQALDNPIIRLSMDIRNRSLNKIDYQYDECKIISKLELSHDEWMEADQVITGKNVTRHRLNKWFRSKLGYEGFLPQKGEKLICLKNMKGKPYINGVQMVCTEDATEEAGRYFIGIEYEDQPYSEVEFYDYHCTKTYNSRALEEPFEMRRRLLELDFAYAITCHKSQGSEWPSVIVADDRMRIHDKENRARWLYTAVTRAKEKLTWVVD